MTLGEIELYLGPGDLRANTLFIFGETLSINILIGPDFLDKYVIGIYQVERQQEKLRSRLIFILQIGSLDKFP